MKNKFKKKEDSKFTCFYKKKIFMIVFYKSHLTLHDSNDDYCMSRIQPVPIIEFVNALNMMKMIEKRVL